MNNNLEEQVVRDISKIVIDCFRTVSSDFMDRLGSKITYEIYRQGFRRKEDVRAELGIELKDAINTYLQNNLSVAEKSAAKAILTSLYSLIQQQIIDNTADLTAVLEKVKQLAEQFNISLEGETTNV